MIKDEDENRVENKIKVDPFQLEVIHELESALGVSIHETADIDNKIFDYATQYAGYKTDNLGNIIKFHISLCAVKSEHLSIIKKLTKLTSLDLSENQITKIEGLDKLEILIFSNNKITKIEGLEYLTNLNVLFLDDNQI